LDKRQLYNIFKTSFKDFLEDDAILRAAALTFFIILPLPTLLLLAVGLFSLFFGQAAATAIIVQQISAVAGPAVAALFNQLITNTGSPFTSAWTTIVVVGFSIGGAIGAFSVLRDTMDCIWEVTLQKGRPLWQRIKQKIVPFGLVSALGLIVIAWTAIATGIFNAISQFSVNSAVAAVGIAISQVVTSFIVATVLLAIIYKMIPESHVHWQDVALASIITGIAFTITNYIFGWYAANFSPTTVAGAAGSLLIILLWIFVLNQIVLFGAEISKVYAVTVGRHAKVHMPKPIEEAAKPIEEVGEKVEETIKEDVIKTGEPTVKSENKEATREHVTEKSEEPKKEEKST
jgi:membrane protein